MIFYSFFFFFNVVSEGERSKRAHFWFFWRGSNPVSCLYVLATLDVNDTLPVTLLCFTEQSFPFMGCYLFYWRASFVCSYFPFHFMYLFCSNSWQFLMLKFQALTGMYPNVLFFFFFPWICINLSFGQAFLLSLVFPFSFLLLLFLPHF